MDPVTTVVFDATLGAWALFEISLRVRDSVRGRGRPDQDRGTRELIGVTFAVAIVLAVKSATVAPSLRIPGHGRVLLAGLIVLCFGLVIRVWAVVALGSAFRTTVEVDVGQAVVARGPYRWVRHPSYTGLLVMMIGFGLGVGNWLALAICAVLPTVSVLRRIRVEEAELNRVLGDSYRAYQMRTARLIPGLW
jgi:protein-S-isoprenylcysteine O-methyltransferase Ste14